MIIPYLYTSAFNISHSGTNLLQFEVGISNDLDSLLHRRSSAEIITSRTLLSGDNSFTDASQLVRCHDNEVTL
jgi:hypothetical protein